MKRQLYLIKVKKARRSAVFIYEVGEEFYTYTPQYYDKEYFEAIKSYEVE